MWETIRGGLSTSRVFIGNIYGIWKNIRGIADLLSRQDLLSIVMGVIFKSGLPQSSEKGLLIKY